MQERRSRSNGARRRAGGTALLLVGAAVAALAANGPDEEALRALLYAPNRDADGRFTLDDRRRGERLDLHVRLGGYAATSVSGIEAPTAAPVTITLETASAIHGRVVDERGRGVERAQVAVQVSGRGLAGPQGAFMAMGSSASASTAVPT